MATTGFILASGQGTWISEHAPQHYCFYTNAKWWMVADDGSGNDFFLYVWDGGFPGTPGTAGNWAKASKAGGGNVNLDTRDTALCSVWWDEANQELHTYSWHSTDQYHKWTYSSVNNNWTESITAQNTSADGTDPAGAFVPDTNGRVWVVYYNAAKKLQVRVRTNGTDSPANTWQADVTLESTAATTIGDSRACVGRATIGGVASIYVFYTYSTGTAGAGDVKFAYRADSAALNASWTSETVQSQPQDIDDHVSTQSIVLLGDTNSTIVGIRKEENNDIVGHVRDDSGTWLTPVTFVTTITRPHLVIDAANEVAYVLSTEGGANALQMTYITSPLPTISWSSATVWLEAASGTPLNNAITPSHVVTAASDLMAGATHSVDGVWWNTITISAPAAPTVDTFTTDQAAVPVAGDTVNLAWTTTGAAYVDINQGVGSGLAADSNIDVLVTTTKTFTLTAVGLGGNTTAQVTVTVNVPPSVNAGADQTIAHNGTVTLDATVTDADGIFQAFTVLWTKQSGPGTVNFANASSVDTTATVSADGTYVLKLTANDGYDTASDTVTIIQNKVPLVDAGDDDEILISGSATLDGTVSDPDSGPGFLATLWTKQSGPGNVTFDDDESVDTTATFSAPGGYVLNLAADDTLDVTSDTVAISVYGVPVVNTFTADPDEIIEGESSLLEWTTTYANTVDINNGALSGGAPDGNVGVSPVVTTQYTLTANGALGSTDTAQVTVTVNPPPVEDDDRMQSFSMLLGVGR